LASFDRKARGVIRPTKPADTKALLALTAHTGVFKSHEVQALDEVLTDYHVGNENLEHQSVTYEEHGEILAFAYWAPASMTDRTWYLYWIAVTKQTQAKGIGGKLLKHVEQDVKTRRGRVLLIETSSLPSYDLTRKFYLKHHYEQAAVIRDFYADGDNLVVFSKRMS
jgi:GNAT superfamily N-acetyltransferase